MEVSGVRKLAGRLHLVLMGALALVIWVLLTLLATRPALKTLWDVSPGAQFTLTRETEKLIAVIRDRGLALRIDTFYAPLQRSASSVAESHVINIVKRIRELTDDLLRQYNYLGGDFVRVEHFDPLTDVARTRERIAELGSLHQQNVLVVSLGKRRKVLRAVLDLAEIDSPGQQNRQVPGTRAAMPTLKTYKGEEAISSAIRSLMVEGTPKIYFLSDFCDISLVEGTANSYSELLGALSDQGFELGILDLGVAREIPEDAAAIAWLEPHRGLSEELAQVVYGYLRRGGRMLINYSFAKQPVSWNPTFRNLGRLLGFEVGEELICHLLRNQQGGVPQVQNLTIQPSPVHPVTRPLVEAGRYPVFKVAREIRALSEPPKGVKVDTGFLRTGPAAWRAHRLGIDGEPSYMRPARQEEYGTISVGAAISLEPDQGEQAGQLLMVGGVAFLNGEGFQRINGDLALNIFNWMTQRDELVTVLGNRYSSKRLEIQTFQLNRIRWFLIAGVPGGLLALALLVFFRRTQN